MSSLIIANAPKDTRVDSGGRSMSVFSRSQGLHLATSSAILWSLTRKR